MLFLLPTHGCLASLFSRLLRKKWRRRDHWLFFFGAVLPDMPVVLVGVVELIKYLIRHPQALRFYWMAQSVLDLLYRNERPELVNYLYTNVGYYHAAIFLRACLHSVFFWIMLAALLSPFARLRRGAAILACGALFFHILMDWPTHTIVAYNYFWPLTLYPARGFISHDNPWLLRAEIAVWLTWLISASHWLTVKIKRRFDSKNNV